MHTLCSTTASPLLRWDVDQGVPRGWCDGEWLDCWRCWQYRLFFVVEDDTSLWTKKRWCAPHSCARDIREPCAAPRRQQHLHHITSPFVHREVSSSTNLQWWKQQRITCIVNIPNNQVLPSRHPSGTHWPTQLSIFLTYGPLPLLWACSLVPSMSPSISTIGQLTFQVCLFS